MVKQTLQCELPAPALPQTPALVGGIPATGITTVSHSAPARVGSPRAFSLAQETSPALAEVFLAPAETSFAAAELSSVVTETSAVAETTSSATAEVVSAVEEVSSVVEEVSSVVAITSSRAEEPSGITGETSSAPENPSQGLFLPHPGPLLRQRETRSTVSGKLRRSPHAPRLPPKTASNPRRGRNIAPSAALLSPSPRGSGLG